MIPIGEKPILWHLMHYYSQFGHKDFVLCLGYKANVIKEFFLSHRPQTYADCIVSGFGDKVEILGDPQQDWRIAMIDTGIWRNIGERLWAVREHVENEEMFLANYSDGLADVNLPEMIETFKQSGKVACFLAARPLISLHFVDMNVDGKVNGIRPPNQLWQTDFTYLKVIGWGWFYLSTILDDFSRYIIAWKLCTTMRAEDVTNTLQLALTASGCASARVLHKPRLLSDNGSSYVSGDKWLEDAGMDHVRGAPCHPQTQGKIERWHQTLKNRILLENYYLPGDLEAHIDRFVDHYNHRRYHESLQNLTPADVYFGHGQTILLQRERIKRETIKHRRLQYQRKAA